MSNSRAFVPGFKCPDDNITFGSNISNAPVNAQDNDTFVVTDTGDANGSPTDVFKFDAETGQWVQVVNDFDLCALPVVNSSDIADKSLIYIPICNDGVSGKILASEFMEIFGVSSNAPLGSAENPFTDLASAAGSSGEFHFDFGSGAFTAHVEDGMVMILQYVHQGGTNPALNVISSGNWPAFEAGGLGADGSANAAGWGHIAQTVAATIPDLGAIRFYAESELHNRVVNFETTVGLAYLQTGLGSFDGVQNSFTPLAGHTGLQPSNSTVFFGNSLDQALTNFPFWAAGQTFWGIRGQNSRWEADDAETSGASRGAHHTIHRVYVRA